MPGSGRREKQTRLQFTIAEVLEDLSSDQLDVVITNIPADAATMRGLIEAGAKEIHRPLARRPLAAVRPRRRPQGLRRILAARARCRVIPRRLSQKRRMRSR
jgi:hypothetical protein